MFALWTVSYLKWLSHFGVKWITNCGCLNSQLLKTLAPGRTPSHLFLAALQQSRAGLLNDLLSEWWSCTIGQSNGGISPYAIALSKWTQMVLNYIRWTTLIIWSSHIDLEFWWEYPTFCFLFFYISLCNFLNSRFNLLIWQQLQSPWVGLGYTWWLGQESSESIRPHGPTPASMKHCNVMGERQRGLCNSYESTYLFPLSSILSCFTPRLMLWLCQPDEVDQPLPWDDHRGNFSISATRPSQVWDTKCHNYTVPYVTSNHSSCYIIPFCHQGGCALLLKKKNLHDLTCIFEYVQWA